MISTDRWVISWPLPGGPPRLLVVFIIVTKYHHHGDSRITPSPKRSALSWRKCLLCIKLQLHLEHEMVENPRDGVRIMQQQNKVKHWIFSNSNNEIVFVHFDIWSTAGNIWILERITDLNCFKLGRNLVGKRIQLISDIGICSTHFAAKSAKYPAGNYKFLTCFK